MDDFSHKNRMEEALQKVLRSSQNPTNPNQQARELTNQSAQENFKAPMMRRPSKVMKLSPKKPDKVRKSLKYQSSEESSSQEGPALS